MAFGHIDRPNFTFGESISFTKVINLIILLPVFGSFVVYLPLLSEKKPTKSNTIVTVRPKCQNKSNVAKETPGKHTYRCTWYAFIDTHHKNSFYLDQLICNSTKCQRTLNNETYCSNAQKSNFSFSQFKNKNGKHTNKADNIDQLTRTKHYRVPIEGEKGLCYNLFLYNRTHKH